MGIRGARGKPPGQAVTRHRPLHGWTEVVDQPNQDAPELPRRRRNGRGWPQYAREIWAVWSSMPHTRLWTPTDWAYCVDALELVVRCAAEDSPVLRVGRAAGPGESDGDTWDARQGMRLRYVAPVEDSGEDGSVSQLDAYRKPVNRCPTPGNYRQHFQRSVS